MRQSADKDLWQSSPGHGGEPFNLTEEQKAPLRNTSGGIWSSALLKERIKIVQEQGHLRLTFASDARYAEKMKHKCVYLVTCTLSMVSSL